MWSDADLYDRGAKTLLAWWEEHARGASGAAVRRSPGVAAAVFPREPERAVYNNALLRLELTPTERTDALDAMEAAYSAAGVTRFAAWIHESDKGMRADLGRRGYALDTWTRAMGITLDHIRPSRPDIELGPADWLEYLRIIGVPPGFLSGADQAAFHVLVARRGGGERGDRDGFRSRRRLRDIQRHHADAGATARAGHSADRDPSP